MHLIIQGKLLFCDLILLRCKRLNLRIIGSHKADLDTLRDCLQDQDGSENEEEEGEDGSDAGEGGTGDEKDENDNVSATSTVISARRSSTPGASFFSSFL